MIQLSHMQVTDSLLIFSSYQERYVNAGEGHWGLLRYERRRALNSDIEVRRYRSLPGVGRARRNGKEEADILKNDSGRRGLGVLIPKTTLSSMMCRDMASGIRDLDEKKIMDPEECGAIIIEDGLRLVRWAHPSSIRSSSHSIR